MEETKAKARRMKLKPGKTWTEKKGERITASKINRSKIAGWGCVVKTEKSKAKEVRQKSGISLHPTRGQL